MQERLTKSLICQFLPTYNHWGLANRVPTKLYAALTPKVHEVVLNQNGVKTTVEGHRRICELYVKALWYANRNQDFTKVKQYIDALTIPKLYRKELREYCNEQVVGIAKKIIDDGDTSRTVILADALQDQDFPDEEYLVHLRTYPAITPANFLILFATNTNRGYRRV